MGENENPNRSDTRLSTHANGITITNVRCICDKVCKNPRSLKIHQARMKCMEQEREVQRTRFDPGETQEEPGQESPHRARSLHAEEPSNPCRIVPQKRIKWPPANSQTLWLQFDEDVSKILQTTAKRETDRCISIR